MFLLVLNDKEEKSDLHAKSTVLYLRFSEDGKPPWISSSTKGLCIKVGREQETGHKDACVGTWDLRTRDEVLEDIKYGTRGRVGRGRVDVKYRDAGDAGCEWLLQKSEVNAISLCYLWSTLDSIFRNHIGHLELYLLYLESNAVILHKFWRPQPTLPCFGLQYSISKKTRTTVSLSSMQGVFAESSLRKQAWRNPKEGRVGCLHQSDWYRIYLRLLQ